jgi:hypothetical protein
MVSLLAATAVASFVRGAQVRDSGHHFLIVVRVHVATSRAGGAAGSAGSGSGGCQTLAGGLGVQVENALTCEVVVIVGVHACLLSSVRPRAG